MTLRPRPTYTALAGIFTFFVARSALASVIPSGCTGSVNGYANATTMTESYSKALPDPSCLSGGVNAGAHADGSYGTPLGAETATADSDASIGGSIDINGGTVTFAGLGSTDIYGLSHAAYDPDSGAIYGAIPASASAQARFDQAFSTNTPTSYLLVVGTLTPDAYIDFAGQLHYGDASDGFALTGILAPGTYTISGVSSLSGEAYATAGIAVTDRAVTGSGEFSYSLSLTPVPIPNAAWLLISGIGSLGALVKRRRAA